MAATLPKRQFALDTNVPLDLAAGNDAALTLAEVCRERGYPLVISPTAVGSLSAR